MPDPDPNEFVYIKHAKVDSVGGPVSRQAYEEVWKDKGWTVASDKDVPDDAPPLPVASTTSTATTTPKGA